MNSPLPQSHLYPYTPASSKEDRLDQFVIQPPHHSKPLSTLALSHPNAVLRLLKVHAAAPPSVSQILAFTTYPSLHLHH